MQGTFVNLCYTMENHAIATMMTYFRSTDHGLGTEVDGGGGVASSKNRLESPLIYIYIYKVSMCTQKNDQFKKVICDGSEAFKVKRIKQSIPKQASA